MRKLLPFAAPARFIFQDPDTQYQYEAYTKKALFDHIISYRAQNNLPPIIALDAVIEDYWCRQPENTGKCMQRKLRRGWIQTLKGGVAVLEHVFFGEDKLVAPIIAEARAFICSTCPKNVFPDKGPFVKWCDKMAEAMTGGRTTVLDDKLGSCEVCTCVLRAKVHYNGDMTPTAEELVQYPDFCWVLQAQKDIK